MGIKLKNSMTAALAAVKSESVGSFTFLGSGAPLSKEGTMSCLLDLKKIGSVLIDCGPRTYERLYDLDVWDRVSAIVLTSSEESSIGSLASVSSMVHKRTQKPVAIICMPHVGRAAYSHLVDANGMSKEMFDFQLANPQEKDVPFGPLPSIRHTFKKTGETTSMFVMDLFVDSMHVYIVYSGPASEPVFNALDAEDVLARMKRNPENVIVLHDASFQEEEDRCYFDDLSEWSNTYRNFFLFGHSTEEGKSIVFSQRYMRSLSTNDSNVFLIEKQQTQR